MINGVSLFSSAGVGESFLSDIGVNITVANEMLPKRAELYRHLYPKSMMICGDIREQHVFDKIIEEAQGIQILMASPPCQGMSVAGKNRHQKTMEEDARNYLVNYVFDAIRLLRPRYVFIENVPMLLKFKMFHNGHLKSIIEILNTDFGNRYQIEGKVVDSADYGVAQSRLRAVIKMYPLGETWEWPQKVDKKTTVEQAIGHLPSLEAGQSSPIKWHYARKHSAKNILWMRHTPTGQTAFKNETNFPQKSDGSRIKGYESSYRRIKWDEPAPTITIRNDCIASQRNVHPGRLLPDGTYSDARVLTPLELMILDSLPSNWNIPDDTPELLIRQVIGESIPPLMVKRIIETLPCLTR